MFNDNDHSILKCCFSVLYRISDLHLLYYQVYESQKKNSICLFFSMVKVVKMYYLLNNMMLYSQLKQFRISSLHKAEAKENE